jgi:hypothetical protein
MCWWLFKVLKKIRDNAFKIKLPHDYEVSTTSNIFNLSSYIDDEPLDSGTSFFPIMEDDSGGLSSNLISPKSFRYSAHNGRVFRLNGGYGPSCILFGGLFQILKMWRLNWCVLLWLFIFL